MRSSAVSVMLRPGPGALFPVGGGHRVILGTTYQSTFRKRAHAMTALHVIDAARFLSEQLEGKYEMYY